MSERPNADSSETTVDHPDEGLPVYRAQRSAEEVPGFFDRVLARLRDDPELGDFVVDEVEIETVAGVWLMPVGAYDPDLDTPSTPQEVAAGASPTGAWGNVMLEWERDVRRTMRESWGEPVLHRPRLVGTKREPEGILDYLLVAQEFPLAELWDRGDLFVALLTRWPGEPAASYLAQVAVVLPRELVMRGMTAFLDEDDTAHELLMYGEHPLEVRRRAWLMSHVFGSGDVRLRDTPIEAVRNSIQAFDGTTTVWTFADDGRALLLVQDPACAFAEAVAQLSETPDDGAASPGYTAEQLILIRRILDGIPEDLLACVAARGETGQGGVAEQPLNFGLLDDQPIPIVSGAFWFDGEVWHTTAGLMELGHRNGFGMDDYGFASAVRRPYRLGGPFTVDAVADPHNSERRRQLEQVFDACPYPEQARPEGDVRLGYGIPSSADREGLLDAVERATEAWWDRAPADAGLGDDTFVVGGRALRGDDGDGVMHAILGASERWTVDALQAWTEQLAEEMTARWGASREIRVEHPWTGVEQRTPLTRVMRGTGLRSAPLWWVNGQAVLLLAGQPRSNYSPEPQTILVICRADALMELLGRASIWETRLRARLIKDAARTIAAADGHQPSPQQIAAEQPIAWDGPPLPGSDLVPLATRGGLRAETFFWAWHFTHDGRALMTSHEIGGTPGDFAKQVDLFTGVPEDLLSLVVDREPAGPYPVVSRDGEPTAPGRLAAARSLPAPAAVFFYDGLDWRASEGTLRQARAAAAAADGDTLAALYSTATGVAQLRLALRADEGFTVATLADPEYARLAFSRTLHIDEAHAVFDQLEPALRVALTGSLNDVLDTLIDGPGYRPLLDAALSNPEPRHRREIALWLLGEKVDASTQLSFMTPVNVLLANPTLDGEDAVLLRRLLESGADAGFGLLGARAGGHPLVQLCDRDVDEAALEPLLDVLLEVAETDDGGATTRYDVTAPLLPDGRSLLEYVSAGEFPHAHPRTRLLERLQRLA